MKKRMRQFLAIVLAMACIGWAGDNSDKKNQWRRGCEQAQAKNVEEMFQANPDMRNRELSASIVKERCDKLTEHFNKRGWNYGKNARIAGCHDGVEFILDNEHIKNAKKRQSLLLEYCF